jgi:CheY-like chemotaxis protein
VRQPALVVLDLVLDEGSGLALLDRIRAADGLASRIDPDLPVIVLSGRAGDADRVRSFARGADDHLHKPTRSFVVRAVEPHLRAPAPSTREGASADRRTAREIAPFVEEQESHAVLLLFVHSRSRPSVDESAAFTRWEQCVRCPRELAAQCRVAWEAEARRGRFDPPAVPTRRAVAHACQREESRCS